MRATEFEFRQRFWLIGLIYWIGFACYSLDRTNAGVKLLALTRHASNPDSPSGRHELQLIFGAGALLCALAALIRTWGAAYLRSEVVHDLNLRTEALVADGPYRYVRNPLYLGTILLSAGIGLMASGLGWFVIVIGNILFTFRLIGREESALAETQGSGYRDYLVAVPRLWPALGPRLPAGGMKPRWRRRGWANGGSGCSPWPWRSLPPPSTAVRPTFSSRSSWSTMLCGSRKGGAVQRQRNPDTTPVRRSDRAELTALPCGSLTCKNDIGDSRRPHSPRHDYGSGGKSEASVTCRISHSPSPALPVPPQPTISTRTFRSSNSGRTR